MSNETVFCNCPIFAVLQITFSLLSNCFDIVPNELKTNGLTQTLSLQNFCKSLQSLKKYFETNLQK